MKKQLIYLTAFLLLFTPICLAHPTDNIPPHHKPTHKQIKEFDNFLDSRLQLTKEQKELLKQNRTKHNKEMKKVVSKMQNAHDKIRNVYLTGIPPFQAKLRTAPYKAELALLMQQAKSIREDARKEFESILTDEQKVEFEKIKKEMKLKREAHKRY